MSELHERTGRASNGSAQAKLNAQQIAERITDAIEHGLLSPGARLREMELAAKYGVGRARIREALNILAASNLVSIEPNRGASVIELDDADMIEVLRIRGELWLLLVELAAERGDRQDRSDLKRLRAEVIEYGKQPTMTAKEFSAQIEKTVQRIAEAARSPQLRTIMRPLTRGLPARYRDLPFATQEWRLKRAEEWDELLTQIIEGNITETRLAADQLYKASVSDGLSLYAMLK